LVDRWKFAAAIGVALLGSTPHAFAQARAWEGCVLPMQFGGQGERHYYANGYGGQFDPPMSRPQVAASAAKRLPRISATR
jgi:hypothetical protein